MSKVLFVPISIVGCGKSTVFRTLHSMYPSFAHIENDNFDNKAAFFNEIRSKLRDPQVSAVLLDRNNHLHMHRKEIIQKFKSDGVILVALLFVPPHSSAQEMRGLVLGRIASRGDNHQQVKGESDFKTAKMIVNSFVKNFAPFDQNDPVDGQFDHVIQMKIGKESSEANVRRIVDFYADEIAGTSDFTRVSNADIAIEFKKSLGFQVDQ
ncbi:hypothetical protein JCM33374_g2519 [Metschnikowia sp. JCM 33374]|nr:hypothetical protein JCM33374_g2519 [Metschnikowia sp. JCM 33374]